MKVWSNIETFLASHGSACLVTILSVQGSAPRKAGTRMVVAPNGHFTGTIGGGTLEWEVIKKSTDLLTNSGKQTTRHTYPLGPQLGQCCGGSVNILFEIFTNLDVDEVSALLEHEKAGIFHVKSVIHNDRVERLPTVPTPTKQSILAEQFEGSENLTFKETFGRIRTNLYLFGAGHIGKALMLTLAPLPFKVSWFDNRSDEFPLAVPANFTCQTLGNLSDTFSNAPQNTFVIALTHSHDTDFAIMHEALKTNNFPFVGVIGSGTKTARFKSKLRALGMDENTVTRMRCPIGYDGIKSKEPSAIALSIATELLMKHEEIHGQQ
jgi:xanthine dehydrogenase accessory factor